MSLRKIARPEILLRVLADALMIQASLLFAAMTRLLLLVFFGYEGLFTDLQSFAQALRTSLRFFSHEGWVLTAVCLTIFSMSGFYSRTRAYRGRRKAIVVVSAVSIGFLLFGFFSYFIPLIDPLPRSVWFASYIFAIISVGGTRLWMFLLNRISPGQSTNQVYVRHNKYHVLVIGGAGYIGSTLSRKLLEKGYKVRVADVLLYGDDGIKDLKGVQNFEFVQGDLRNVETLVRSLRGIDSVVHLGEIVGDPACSFDEELTREINFATARMIGEAAKGAGVNRFVYSSSCSVYGASDQILDENSALSPISLYARAKIATESALLELKSDQFQPTILRFGTVYGKSYRQRFDLVINLLTAKAVVEGEITIYGGEQWRPFIHVNDAADALMLCLTAPLPRVGGEIFNTGSDTQNLKILELGEMICDIIPNTKLALREEEIDRRNYRVSFRKINLQLGFTPHMTIEEGVQELVKAIKSGNFGDYRQAKYSNHKTISDGNSQVNLKRKQITPLYASPSLETYESQAS